MATVSIRRPSLRLTAEERSLLERAIQRGYLVDKTYAISLARTYTDWAWRVGRPTMIAFPWRRHWYAAEVGMPHGLYLTESGIERLNDLANEAMTDGFQGGLGFQPIGTRLWGLRPEAVETFAAKALRLVGEPGVVVLADKWPVAVSRLGQQGYGWFSTVIRPFSP
jgi:hypothetical protein